jgi:hypothetical protein
VLEDCAEDVDVREGIEWKIKIEKHMYEGNHGNEVRCGGLRTYIFNKRTQRIQKFPHSNID